MVCKFYVIMIIIVRVFLFIYNIHYANFKYETQIILLRNILLSNNFRKLLLVIIR